MDMEAIDIHEEAAFKKNIKTMPLQINNNRRQKKEQR